MIIGLFICSIGIIPMMLALNLIKVFNESKLSNGFFLFFTFVTIWQFDIGVLYFIEIWNKETILFLFKLFRIGPTFTVLSLYYIAYLITKNQPTSIHHCGWLNIFAKKLFNKRILYVLITLSTIIYVINWTDLGISDLKVITGIDGSFRYYFPVYGSLHFIYTTYHASFIIFWVFAYFISRTILNIYLRKFLKVFLYCCLLIFISGMVNFAPGTGSLSSSVGVIIFSTFIMMEFTKMNSSIKLNMYQLQERQKKLEYTGNLTGSLIHEVKNTNQIIVGFSKMLNKSESLTMNDKSALEMITKASEHLGELASNYKEYMKSSKMTFKIEDLEAIINESIGFSNEIVKEHEIEMEFINHYKPLRAYVNKTYLQQVFINLIKNSSEAIPKTRKNKKITIKTEINNNSIVIHFMDTGKGIPPGNWESVFDPFISFKERGMGLGLPFVKKVISEHLGNISIVQSTPEGTHFQIEIPQNGIIDIN